jgi:hypothetical protein
VIGMIIYGVTYLLDMQFNIIYSYYLGIYTNHGFILTLILGLIGTIVYTIVAEYGNSLIDKIERLEYQIRVEKRNKEEQELYMAKIRKNISNIEKESHDFIYNTEQNLTIMHGNFVKLVKEMRDKNN